MSDPLVVEIERKSPLAVTPTQGNESDAGYDLSSIVVTHIGSGERALIRTGIAVAIPEGHVGYIKPRSGLALNYGIDVLGGVIDSGYRGEIRVILLNTNDAPFIVGLGDRIAQLVVQPVSKLNFSEVDALGDSVRGANGFGSTGVAS